MLKFLSYLTRAVSILVTMHLRSHQTGRSSFRSIYMVHRNASATTPTTPRNHDDDSDYSDTDDDCDDMLLPPSLAATDSEDNSDSMAFQRGASAGGNTSGAGGGSSSAASPAGGKSGRPCQYNFLVNLGEFLGLVLLEGSFTKLPFRSRFPDPALNSAQRVAILKKKIQELRKTYNAIKAELASIDRRRKKLRRRERENKKQAKLAAAAAAAAGAANNWTLQQIV